MIVKKRTTNNKVEIVILCMNNLKITKQFLTLLFANTTDFDAIIIDNNSTDSTPAFLRDASANHKNVTLVLNDINLGVAGGRNQGYKISCDMKKESEYILFIDNDQLVKPGWLDHYFDIMKRGYDIIGPEAWQMSNTFFPTRKNTKLTEWYCYVGGGGSLIRKSVPKKIGMYDDQFNPCYFEDPDFSFRAHKENFKIGWNFKAKLTHVPHQTLGNAPDKPKNFVNSYNRFRAKWKNHKVPKMYQVNIPEFS